MRATLTFMLMMMAGCNRSQPKADANWYDVWLSKKLHQGAVFQTEFALKSGGTHTLSINVNRSIEVGFVVKDGYEISKSNGTIYLGTVDHPKIIGASPGAIHAFTEKNGEIVVLFENTSPFDTRLAVYTNETKAVE